MDTSVLHLVNTEAPLQLYGLTIPVFVHESFLFDNSHKHFYVFFLHLNKLEFWPRKIAENPKGLGNDVIVYGRCEHEINRNMCSINLGNLIFVIARMQRVDSYVRRECVHAITSHICNLLSTYVFPVRRKMDFNVNPDMLKNGFAVFSCDNVISVKERARMLNIASHNDLQYVNLFNDTINTEKYTGRAFVQLNELTKEKFNYFSGILQKICEELGKQNVLFDQFHVTDFLLAAFLYSYADAFKITQVKHKDYNLRQNYPAHMRPFSVLFSLHRNAPAYLWCKPYKSKEFVRVHVPVGQVVVFYGDVYHYGDSYDMDHYRLHFYVSSKADRECEIPNNTIALT